MVDTVFNLLLANTLVFLILFACVLLIKVVFKRKLSAFMQYALWIVVIAKLLVPVSFTMQWSPYILLHNAQAGNVETVDTGICIVMDDNPILSAYRIISGAGTTARVFQIDFKALAICIWIAGAAYYAVWVATRSLQLKMMIGRGYKGDIPKRMNDVFQRCKIELGIYRNIRLVIQGCLPVPAIMGALRPILLVPEKFMHCTDDEKLRHVFIHELMHYKRKDLWVIWVLNIVNAVYWFNPLTWLCIRLIYRDMETACDSRVVQTLGIQNRKAYIGTILYFSSKQRAMQIHAAMSLNDGCAKMKKRIMGMYLAKKTKRPVGIVVVLLACMLAFAGFTSGRPQLPDKTNAMPDDVAAKPSYSPGASAQVPGLQNTIIYSGSMAGVTIGINPYDTLEALEAKIDTIYDALEILEAKRDALLIFVTMK